MYYNNVIEFQNFKNIIEIGLLYLLRIW